MKLKKASPRTDTESVNHMEMDVYECGECNRSFATEKDEEVKSCPNCMSELFEFSHEIVAVQKVKRPLTMQREKVT
ncbi:hypothetical protein RJD24_18810 [Bacillaceae bacterium IKA-2]|nr:hypothetical protein RJD24_18810 [Bacillaceae bacterium IKA-2]